MAAHNDLGASGEELATEFLTKKGYTILEKNWRYQKSEIDIIAKKNKTLIVIEVKTRTTNYFGEPQIFINKNKIQRLVIATNAYVTHNHLDINVRFDIIAIISKKDKITIKHLKNGFLYF